MSTRTEFVQGMKSSDLSYTILNCFDEIMVLYNLIGSREDLKISTDKDDDASQVDFILKMQSAKDAKELYNNLNNSSFTVYGIQYDIQMEIDRAKIITTITKASV